VSTAKTVVVVLVLLVAFGIVGRMDYEEAKRVASANAEEGIRLCVRFPVDVSGEHSLSNAKRATALLVTVDESTPFEAPPPTLLRCVVVEE